jgi:hypothetical protein
LVAAGCGDENFINEAPPGTGGSAGSGTNGGSSNGGSDNGGSGGGGGSDVGATCMVSFVTPSAGNADSLTLGSGDDVDGEGCGEEFATDVVLSSTAQTVTLFVNDAAQGTQALSALTTTFDGVVLTNRGDDANSLRAVAEMPDGSTCEATFSASIFVDCAGPSCSLGDPGGGGTFFSADRSCTFATNW